MIDIIYSTLALLIASIEDLKKKEVSDTLNYSLLTSLLFYYILTDPLSDLVMRIGLMIFLFVVGYVLYLARVFGGGDVKLLSWLSLIYGKYLGEILGNLLKILLRTSFILIAYIFLWSVYLLYVNKERRKIIKKEVIEKRKGFVSLLSIPLLYLAINSTNYLKLSFLLLSIIFLLFPLISAIDTLMIIEKSPEELVEGDWVEEDIIVNGKVICSKKDPGLTKEQIEELKKLKNERKIKKVKVREGIPLVPAILLTHINLILTILK